MHNMLKPTRNFLDEMNTAAEAFGYPSLYICSRICSLLYGRSPSRCLDTPAMHVFHSCPACVWSTVPRAPEVFRSPPKAPEGLRRPLRAAEAERTGPNLSADAFYSDWLGWAWAACGVVICPCTVRYASLVQELTTLRL